MVLKRRRAKKQKKSDIKLAKTLHLLRCKTCKSPKELPGDIESFFCPVCVCKSVSLNDVKSKN